MEERPSKKLEIREGVSEHSLHTANQMVHGLVSRAMIDVSDTKDNSMEEEDKVEPVERSESFFDLLQTFAQLDLPELPENASPEKCPLCPLSFPLGEFATHVLQCIKQLDEVEREHQSQLDAKLAQRLAQQDGILQDFSSNHGSSFWNNSGESAMNSSFSQPPSFTPPIECPDGLSCSREDENHFKQLRHPSVPCPICALQFEIYQVNTHLTLCLAGDASAGPFHPLKLLIPLFTTPHFSNL